MKKQNKVVFLFVIAALVLPAVIYGMYHFYRDNIAALPYYGENYSIESNSGQKDHFQIPDVLFWDQHGQPHHLKDIGPHIKVINFFYTTCGTICPVMMRNMLGLQQQLSAGNVFDIISFSVDPERDSVSRMAAYAQNLGIKDSHWLLATGHKPELYQFARKGVFLTLSAGDGGEDDFIHSEKLVLIDPQNHIRGYYDGTDKKSIGQLISDINRIKN